MTIAQLTGAWSAELAEGEEDPKQCEQNLVHILTEDILNGRLDDSGPLRDDGQRLGLRLITPEHKPGFIKGPQLHELIQINQSRVLHNVLVMKEAVLDFAQRHHLPSPSWWADSSTPTEVPNTKVNVAKPNTEALASRSLGKQPRILKYLSEHFPAGVPEPGLCPRHNLKSDIRHLRGEEVGPGQQRQVDPDECRPGCRALAFRGTRIACSKRCSNNPFKESFLGPL
jgi:hypothetical protein